MQRRRPAPVGSRRKTGDDHDFLATGNVFVRLGNSATLHLSVQMSMSIGFPIGDCIFRWFLAKTGLTSGLLVRLLKLLKSTTDAALFPKKII